jgi:GTPase SAR1 family protein
MRHIVLAWKSKTFFYFFVNEKFATVFRASGEDVRLMLWDTAGQEEFNAITKAYYRGAQVRHATSSTSLFRFS